MIFPCVSFPVVHEHVAAEHRHPALNVRPRRLRSRYPDVRPILLRPGIEIGAHKWTTEIHFNWKLHFGTGSHVVPEPCIRLTSASKDKHHGPVRAAKHT